MTESEQYLVLLAWTLTNPVITQGTYPAGKEAALIADDAFEEFRERYPLEEDDE